MAATDNGNGRVLRSDWSGVNPNLIATFYALKRKTADDQSFRWARDEDEPEVQALISDGSVEHAVNWNSPFENQNLDQSAGTLSGLLQSGAFVEMLGSLASVLQGKEAPGGGAVTEAQRRLEGLFGKSNVTKLNSTQIFTGLPPMQISLTIHFRALTDPEIEVESPAQKLIQWALPQKLAADGPVIGLLKGEGVNLFPSTTPRFIAMRFANRLYAPLVIESIPYELTGPRDAEGRLINTRMQCRLASLTSIDALDWEATRNPARYNTATR